MHLGFTIFSGLLFGTIGLVISLIIIAPFYFTSKHSEKDTIEKVIMIVFPCVGAVIGLVLSTEGVEQEAAMERAQNLERQQRSSRISESTQRPESPEIQHQPKRTPGTIFRHFLATLS